MRTARGEKRILFCGILAVCLFGVTPPAYGMHIMEGYLPPRDCIAWGIAALPFLLWGMISIRRILKRDRRNITLLAMSGAFIFVISSLKIPSVTGSCSHMTGTGLGAILFGPAPVAVLGLIVLLFQALLLAHGGITTLGANMFSMAAAGPVAAYVLYRLLKRMGANKKVCIFLAAFAGDLSTYCVTALQLALSYPSQNGGIGASMLKFLAVFAPTQLPLAVVEGILTLAIMIVLETYAGPELRLAGGKEETRRHEHIQ